VDEDQGFYRFANKGYLDWAAEIGFIGHAEQIVFQLYSEPLQRFRLAAQGHGDIQPPERERARVAAYFDPLPFWYAPFDEAAVDTEDYPLHALSQRPMAMYHSWGSQNAWLRQIHTANHLYLHPTLGAALGVGDDDWVWVESHHGQVKAPVRLMGGVNPDTVWTWNAIGKRRGAWGLDPKAPEATKGFLLNHIISELLPAHEGGYRYSNSDPVTGQAAWYDLRVRLRKCLPAEAGVTEPAFAATATPPGMDGTRQAVLRYGAGWRAQDSASDDPGLRDGMP